MTGYCRAIDPLGSVIGKERITSMPHWGGVLSDRDVKALNAYLKTLE